MSEYKFFYGWIVVVISLICLSIVYAVLFSWPVFFKAIFDQFDWSRANTSIIIATSEITYAFTSPASGFFLDKLGPRKLFTLGCLLLSLGAAGCSYATEIWHFALCYGIGIGLGASFTGFLPFSVLVSRWFVRLRGTALSIATLGGRDSFLLVPLIQMLITVIGWREAYLILAGTVILIIIPLVRLLKGFPEEMGLYPDGDDKITTCDKTSASDDYAADREGIETEWTLIAAIKTIKFWGIFLVLLGAAVVFAGFINHIFAYATDLGFNEQYAANLFYTYAIISMGARILGFISDKIGREWTLTAGMMVTFLAYPILLITPDASSPWKLHIFMACFGFGSGIYAPCYTAAAADLFQGKKLGLVMGSINIGAGLGTAISTWFFGYVFDSFGSYRFAIWVIIFFSIVMILGIWIAGPRKVRRKIKDKDTLKQFTTSKRS